MKILVVRFKQIGDSILASPMCNTLKKTFPDAEIDYVLYEHVSPIFKNHKYIDNVISITKEEQKNPFKYIAKVWKVTRKKYDIVIDIMSTPKSEMFTLFSLGAKYRIGRKKKHRGYTYTHKIEEPRDAKDKVDKFLKMLKPLEKEYKLVYDNNYIITITPEEKKYMREKMEKAGIDFTKPVIACSINSRVPAKVYPVENMVQAIKKLLNDLDIQIIFYYSPDEKQFAKNVHENMLGNDKR
ncbi:MAG: glycosyltransferase family 9 protein, partial [Fusobacterium sp.]